jgi:hypothetical protein
MSNPIRLRVKVQNPQWAYRQVYAKYMHIPEFFILEGVLKKKHRWAPEGEFMLMTGNPKCPTHIINRKDVLEAWIKR